jgi:hypothetical protein
MTPDRKAILYDIKTPEIRSAATIGRRRSVSRLNRRDGWPRVYVRVLLKPNIQFQKGLNNFGFLSFAPFAFRFVHFLWKFWPRFRDAWGRTPLWNSLSTFSHWYFKLHSGEEATMLNLCHSAVKKILSTSNMRFCNISCSVNILLHVVMSYRESGFVTTRS